LSITDPLVLPPDVLLIPVKDLKEEVRNRFEHAEGDHAITHPRSRTPSRILDGASAELLAQFKSPRTIVEAVIHFSRAHAADPEKTLESAYPLLQRLLDDGFLVTEGAVEAQGILPSLRAGEEVAGFEILEGIQVLEDTELYQARGPEGTAALKIERPTVAGARALLFRREAAILRHLDGAGAPRLLAAGELDGRCYLATTWCPGVDAATAARGLRLQGEEDRAALVSLCREIAAAYARLHERGVLHGDVHPRNVLVAADGGVRLLDFGVARWDQAPAELSRPWRVGVAFYYEPEYAASVRTGHSPPAVTLLGEQYAVAALLYLLATGAHYRDFSLERTEMLRQIAEELPLPFAARGAEPWTDLEGVLARALRKSPEERFPSTVDFAAALSAVAAPPARPGKSRAHRPEISPAESLLVRTLESLSPESLLFTTGLPAPRASVAYGGAGIAHALYRIALAWEDAALLSHADLWAERAAAESRSDGAFYNPEGELSPESVGRASVYHTVSGVHTVRALIAHALGLPGLRAQAVRAFLAALGDPPQSPELMLGRTGQLLAGALLLDTLGDNEPERALRGDLLARGGELLHGVWRDLEKLSPVQEVRGLPNLGMAHGWAGFLYGSLRWCRAAASPLPEKLRERLAELADCAQLWGRGLRWRWYGTHAAFATMPGWCNGSAGFVFLWTLAQEVVGDAGYGALAEGAAWDAYDAPASHGDLCCGLAGRAYALLNLHRHGAGREWLGRARELADRAAAAMQEGSESSHSLYKGALGVAVLAADLARPEAAAMPFFEEEGWV
jgi:eukaryotic-like serine/threonine-protein kinase